MATRKYKKRNPQPAQPLVRLSQCMIVKNEERNIEKALSWARGIAFEQVVVDTGSTDRTVELAEKMGAKVFHFEWINDFSAAKNFAIEQATGNWIVFLDADEFFSHEDARKLLIFLKRIQASAELRGKWLALNTPLVNVDDHGKPLSVYDQERVFRNLPGTRYHGRIHEQISVDKDNTARVDEIRIVHTGYASSVYDEGIKAQRNVVMLRAELADKPDDMNAKVYLADALRVIGDEESLAEAEIYYQEAVQGGPGLFAAHKKRAYAYFLDKYLKTDETLPQCEELCQKALAEFVDSIDFEYYLGCTMNKKGDYEKAWEIFKGCEAKLINAVSIDESATIMAKPMLLFSQMVLTAFNLDNPEGIVRYATMVLAEDKTLLSTLSHYIATLRKNNVSDDEVFGLLGKLYDFTNPQDLLLIATAAKDSGALDFAKRMLETTGLMDKLSDSQ